MVEPSDVSDQAALHAALAQLAEQDPLIDVRQDDIRHEITISLYGEVQKEVIQARRGRVQTTIRSIAGSTCSTSPAGCSGPPLCICQPVCEC